jgi:hypothetical protein
MPYGGMRLSAITVLSSGKWKFFAAVPGACAATSSRVFVTAPLTRSKASGRVPGMPMAIICAAHSWVMP